MNLRLLHSQIYSLKLDKLDDSNEASKDEKSFSLGYNVQYDPNEDTVFSIIFDIKVIHPSDFQLECQYVTWFKTSEAINEDFKNSDFTTTNAPAIAFPFLRTFISNLTLNAGYVPALLPSINFLTFKNKQEETIKSS